MRLGTRSSALALAQANAVAELLGGAEIVPITTGGDRDAGATDKSRWVAELEAALQRGEIDLAVHSAKDVPGELADGLELLGAPARASPEDVLCGVGSLEELAPGARVGTSSIRRLAQLRAAREDLDVVAVRGNVDTRLRKLADAGERLDALVLARAGLERLERTREAGGALDLERFVPAPGQGTLALQGRAADDGARRAASGLSDPHTFAALRAERELAHALGATCDTPLGAHAAPAGHGLLRLRAWVGTPDGSAWACDELLGSEIEPGRLGREVAERLRAAGAQELLAGAMPPAAAGGG
jgi:hydroxymethylbilane synthase